MATNIISAYPTIGPGNYNESTNQWENGNPYFSDEGGSSPGASNPWNYDERSGTYTRLDPNYQIPQDLTIDDIKNGIPYAFDAVSERIVADPYGQSPVDKNAYYNDLASTLADKAFMQSAINGDPSRYTNLLNSIKEVDPKAYYTGQIGLLSQQAGQYAVGKPGQEAQFNQQIQALLPEAMQYGVTPEEINSIYGNGYSQGGQTMQTINANKKEQGGSLTPLVQGIKIIGPAMLGMYGLDAALTAGLGAAYGAGTGMATTGIGSGLGGAAAMDAGLAAGAGSLGAGGFGLTAGSVPSLIGGLEIPTGSALTGTTAGAAAIPAGGAVSSLGSLAWTPSEIGGSAGFLNPTLGANTASTGFGLTAADIPSLATGLEVPTSGALSGLDATKDMSLSDVLSNANRVKNGVSTLAKMLGGNSTGGTTGATGTTGSSTGVNAQQLASLLGAGLPIQSAPGGLYRMNQNPFSFGTQGQTPVSQGMYDVSGTNPMANALRKA